MRRSLYWVAAIVSFGVAACGGGDDSSTPAATTTYTVGGVLAGLPAGATIVLQNNGGNDLSLVADGSFAFSSSLSSGAAYSVSVGTTPAGQTCLVSNGNGTVAAANVTQVAVVCSYTHELVSRNDSGTLFGTYYDSETPVVSGDGRYVAFVSYGGPLAGNATTSYRQIYRHDRLTHTTLLVSADDGGTEGNNNSFAPAISDDGRYVAFESYASNLVSGVDTNATRDVFVRDIGGGTTTRVSNSTAGSAANAGSFEPSLSGDGTTVAFTSYASNLVSSGVTGTSTANVYRAVLATGLITLISADVAGSGAGGSKPALSRNGSRLAFWSYASNLVASDANGAWDIFLYEVGASPALTLVSVSSAGTQRDSGTESISRIVAPAISADGRFIAYATTSTNLVANDTNGVQDVFLFDTEDSTTSRASVTSAGVEGNADSPAGQGERVALSEDGNWVAFSTSATNLGAGANNVVMHERATGAMHAVSPAADSGFKGPAISADGRYVAYMSNQQLDPRFTSSGVFVTTMALP